MTNSQDNPRRAANRNLLFGVLAWQTGIISESQLLAGLKQWTLQKHKTTGRILIDQSALTDLQLRLLDPMVDAQVALHADDPGLALQALSSVPGIAVTLQKQIRDDDVQASLTHIIRSSDSRQESSEAPSATFVPSARQGVPPAGDVGPDDQRDAGTRYRILRPHAAGGLGEVSVALDSELNREVAFKEIRREHAHNQEAQNRFRLEAEITGGLEHPGIVPVYGLGNFSDGRPFYAMRFIRGRDLKEATTDYHAMQGTDADSNLAFRELLRRFIDVCDAVGYAHSRGVLHRDLKPGNIMLGKYGETLVVDWGLAKTSTDAPIETTTGERALRPASGSGVTPTLMGSAVGTPAFMPPEQAAGQLDQLGPATDVYSLGATLFYVLTGVAPFEGATGDVLRQVQHEPVPSPRTKNSNVPIALAAICLKAMSKRASDRYVTPHDLSADVERFLADQPVTACVDPIRVRVRRWIKKHQVLATTTAVVLVLSTIGLATTSAIVGGKNKQLAELNSSLDDKNSKLAEANDDERAARLLAQANAETARTQTDLALSTLNSVIIDIQGGLEDVAGAGPVRRKLLNTALDRLQQISTEFAGDGAVDRQTMLAFNDMADVFLRVGVGIDADDYAAGSSPSESARNLYERANDIAKQLAAASPADPRAQYELSISYNMLGHASLQAGDVQEALGFYQQAFEISKALVAADPANDVAQHSLMTLCDSIGDATLQTGNMPAAREAFQQSLAISEQLVAASSADVEAQRSLSLSLDRMGWISLRAGRVQEAIDFYKRFLSISETLGEVDPANAQAQIDLATAYDRLGRVHLQVGQLDEALVLYKKFLAISLKLSTIDPSDTQTQLALSIAYDNLGDISLKTGQMQEAREYHQESLKVRKQLAAADPSDTEAQRALSVTYENLGDVSLKTGELNDALDFYRQSSDISSKRAASDPNDARAQRGHMVSHTNIGTVYERQFQFVKAAEEYGAAVKILKGMIARGMNVEQSQRELRTVNAAFQSAEKASIAFGDWETLMMQPAETLPTLLDLRAVTLAQSSRFEDAAAAAAKLRGLEESDDGQLYNAACVFSLCAASIVPPPGQELTAEQEVQRKAWIDEAIITLKQAIDAGWDDFDHMQKDSDLAILRDLSEFKALTR
jgi:eukaryotic-like serine/threonine-protein kinase